MSLTDLECRNAKPQASAYKLTDGQGLFLYVMPSGGKSWRLKFRFMGKEKGLTIGPYPTFSLAEARERREQARKELATGINPAAAKQEKKREAAQSAATTFELVAREWHEHNISKWTPNYAADILHRMEMDIFPEIGALAIADIRPLQVLDTAAAKSAPPKNKINTYVRSGCSCNRMSNLICKACVFCRQGVARLMGRSAGCQKTAIKSTHVDENCLEALLINAVFF